jgi:hypothetical protein
MGYEAGRSIGDDCDLKTTVATLVTDLPDENLRAQFIGFAELHSRAA